MDSALLHAETHSESVARATPAEFSALEHYLTPVRRFLDLDVTEVCINRPGEVWTESIHGWERHDVPELTFSALQMLSNLSANATGQEISARNPVISAHLPSQERMQIVMPPATTPGCVSMTIRKPSVRRFTMDTYAAQGFFDTVTVQQGGIRDHEVELKNLLKANEIRRFLEVAVKSRATILVSGATGSGKTSFMKMLVDMIASEERLITVEDTPELSLENQPNHVRLFYSKGGRGASAVKAGDLIESAMRMKPERILLAEVRDDAAYYFIGAANTGHPGSITSVHANSERDAFGRMAYLLRGAEAAKSMGDDVTRQLILQTVDVVVHIGKINGKRAVTGIYYEPERKYSDLG
ncbi:P-type DNA transfer ATPase VirB11 [Xanthomonas campestris pv. mirabilis]|uniref:P-type DNA transfer ATPase VirB11 n=1 Tax=Xanthomonas euvesicatoria TaxID=456327 RepID=UPI001C495BF8|nr:P-type DNA transfer ATPase VirB11 [Xanthomonas euvesicatoria]MBV6855861.1 P-type DNA transfer ATPase VirB11 [Xanthomonas campestris pv. mirabilis]